MKLSVLVEGLEYELLCGSLDTEVNDIQNDSRYVARGDLFFCISGAKTDGHSYADGVMEKGASVLVVEKEVNYAPYDVTVIKVKSSRYAMGVISSKFYGEPSKKLTVIGITGTKGKTTTTYMIREMLEAAGKKTGLIGTIEIIDGKNHIHAKNTTPESVELHRILRDMVNNGLRFVVMEVSSQGLMLDRVAGVWFDYAIYTNLSKDHIGPNEHKSFEEYRMWKAKLFTMCKVGIINVDDAHADYIIGESNCDIVTYGMNQDADYKAEQFMLYREGGVLGISYELLGKLTGHIDVDLPGEFSVHNSLAAIAIAHLAGVSFDDIKTILKTVKIRGRVEMIPISDKFTLMIDYAHNAMALESLLMALKDYSPKRLVSVFGCGGDRSRDRRFEMGEVSGNLADFTIITSDNPRTEEPQAILDDIKTGIEKTDGAYIDILDRKEAMRYAIMNAEEGDVIVFAGKGHEDYQEINGVKYHMDERDLIREILEEEDVTKICGYNNRYFPLCN
ncbi:MAG: UDP-N-acetylmuramoyl-L-alanyl-D-glutamate--2,6-diaminopimelate ligase [Clostridium sp.]|nr:UDP-N-acetylmuramoyl-L-alanyl-D-glutamate--2,6-diaminopimelate ligase [Clostridium sp.]MCM1171011.1 UDP-N-acetylmuramoyl-L-alanyl-D-glutamate--2,6-diaminopimelate ligase [Clostridium sp.]MCM1208010.1 UDP-N-acetylmuramoyl-L-alanyl-D-glutamate--2,6-diaminopimelate ligase [Ruminococcus sp.]